LAAFGIGLTKSGFGSGVGLMLVPMTAIAMGHLPRGAAAALGLLLPLLILGDLLALFQYRRTFSMRVVRGLLPGSIVGVILGSLLLAWFHRQTGALLAALIRIEIGLESIGLVGLHWWRQWRGVQQRLMREPARGLVTGAFAGTSSTLAHAAGPIVAMYMLPLGLDRQLFVGTGAIYWFLLNTAKLPGYWFAGQFKNAELAFTVRFAPLVLIGAVAGLWINRRLSDRTFTRIVYVVTFLLGWYILYDGLRVMWT
jgi:uncharacterized membrane protein YfcA